MNAAGLGKHCCVERLEVRADEFGELAILENLLRKLRVAVWIFGKFLEDFAVGARARGRSLHHP